MKVGDSPLNMDFKGFAQRVWLVTLLACVTREENILSSESTNDTLIRPKRIFSYAGNESRHWTFSNPEDTTIRLSISVFELFPLDILVIEAGNETLSLTKDSNINGFFIANQNSLSVYFVADQHVSENRTFVLKMFAQMNGGFYTNDGAFPCNSVDPKLVSLKSVYLFKFPEEFQIMVSFDLDKWPENTTAIEFSTEEQQIARFTSMEQIYPVFSPKHFLLVTVEGTDCINGTFEGVAKGFSTLNQEPAASYLLTDVQENKNYTWIATPSQSITNAYQMVLHIGPFQNFSTNELHIFDKASAEEPIVSLQSLSVARTLYLKKEFRTLYTSAKSSHLDPQLSMNYEVLVSDCAKLYDVDTLTELSIVSPGYPTDYGFLANCVWKFTNKNLRTLHISVDDLDVHDSHNITINNQRLTSTNDIVLNDTIITISFKTDTSGIQDPPHRGFSFTVKKFDCGQTYHQSDTFSESTPATDVPTKYQCVWMIDLLRDSSQLLINTEVAVPPENATLKLYDGGKFSAQEYDLFELGEVLSTTNIALIEYTFEGTSELGVNFSVAFSARNKSTPVEPIFVVNATATLHFKNNTSYKWKYQSVEDSTLRLVFGDGYKLQPLDVLLISSEDESISLTKDSDTSGYFVANGNEIDVTFHADNSSAEDRQFTIIFSAQSNGGYFNSKGSLPCKKVKQNSVVPDSIYLFQFQSDAQVSVKLDLGTWPKLTKFIEFSTPEQLIANFTTVDDVYPVFSPKQLLKMRVYGSDCIKGDFDQVPKGYNTLSQEATGSYLLTEVNKNDYTWIIDPRPGISNSDTIALHVNSFQQLGNSHLQIFGEIPSKKHPIIALDTLSMARTLHIPKQIKTLYTSETTGDSQLAMNYEVVSECYEQYVVDQISSETLLSPGYPNGYPFLSKCLWQFANKKNQTLQISVEDWDVYQAHNVSINDKIYSQQPTSEIVLNENAIDVAFDTNIEGIDEFTLFKGVSLKVTKLDCGQTYTLNDKIVEKTAATNKSITRHCVWLVDIPREPSNLDVNVKINTKSKNATLKLYDGGRLNATQHNLFEITHITSRTHTILVEYIFNGTSASAVNFEVQFKSQTCTKTCGDGKTCMQPSWMCNGQNDCGDYSDEIKCDVIEYNTDIQLKDMEVASIDSSSIKNLTSKHDLVDCHWAIKGFDPKASDLSLRVKIDDIKLNGDKDVLIFYDKGQILQKFTFANQGTFKDLVLVTSGPEMLVTFFANTTIQKNSTFKFNVVAQSSGGHIYTEKNLHLSNIVTKVSYFAVETADMKQVLTTFNISGSLPDYELSFYEGFYESEQNKIISLGGINDEGHFAFSNGNKMLIVARNFQSTDTVDLDIGNVDTGSDKYYSKLNDDIILSSVEREVYNWYIKPQAEGTIIMLALKRLRLQTNETVVVYEGSLNRQKNVIKIFESPLESPYVIHAHGPKGVKISFTSNGVSTNNAVSVIDISYEVLPKTEFVKDVTLNVSTEALSAPYVITSPGYPNQYPFHASCEWNFTHELDLLNRTVAHVTFDDMDLNPAHTILITQGNETLLTVSGAHLPNDLIITKESFSVLWSSTNSSFRAPGDTLGKGFKISITPIAYGEEDVIDYTLSSTPVTENVPLPNGTAEGYILIHGPEHSMIEYKNDKLPDNVTLTVYEGGSIRSPKAKNQSFDEYLLSDENQLLLIYTAINRNEPAHIKFFYEMKACYNKSERCDNGKCLHPDWRCNGENNCGDNTDELGCNFPPAPAAAPTPGISKGWLAGAIIISLIIGAALAVLIPIIVKRIRQGHIYQQFSNSETEE